MLFLLYPVLKLTGVSFFIRRKWFAFLCELPVRELLSRILCVSMLFVQKILECIRF